MKKGWSRILGIAKNVLSFWQNIKDYVTENKTWMQQWTAPFLMVKLEREGVISTEDQTHNLDLIH